MSSCLRTTCPEPLSDSLSVSDYYQSDILSDQPVSVGLATWPVYFSVTNCPV